MHLHKWSNWVDVELSEKASVVPLSPIPLITVTNIIRQQKRCSVCNMVKTRASA